MESSSTSNTSRDGTDACLSCWHWFRGVPLHGDTCEPQAGGRLVPHLLPGMRENHRECCILKIVTAWTTWNAHVIISHTSAIFVCGVQDPNLELNMGNERQEFEAL